MSGAGSPCALVRGRLQRIWQLGYFSPFKRQERNFILRNTRVLEVGRAANLLWQLFWKTSCSQTALPLLFSWFYWAEPIWGRATGRKIVLGSVWEFPGCIRYLSFWICILYLILFDYVYLHCYTLPERSRKVEHSQDEHETEGNYSFSQNDIIRRRGSPDPFHQPSKARAVCATWPLLAISWSETCFLQFRDSSLQTCWDRLLGVEWGVRQHQWVLRCLKMPFKHLSNLILLSRGSNHQAKVVSYYLGDRLVHRQGDVVSFGPIVRHQLW